VIVPSIVLLVPWFIVAPDPRFVWALLWIIPAALVAWLVPDLTLRLNGLVVVAALALGGSLAALAVLDHHMLLPAALGVAILAGCSARILSSRLADLVALGCLAAAVPLVVGIAGGFGAFRPYVANHKGPLGTVLVRRPKMVYWTTNTNLGLWRPDGTDQCFATLFCTPYQDFRIFLRGKTLSDGLRMTPFPSG